MGTGQAGHSPLTDELLALGEKVTDVLDYEHDLQEEPEIIQAVANIPKPKEDANIEMEEANPPPGFEPKFGHSGYDVNLVRPSDNTAPGTVSLVTQREDRMLDEEPPQTRASGTGRLGSDKNPCCPITKKK